MTIAMNQTRLTPDEFDRFTVIIHDTSGIHMPADKLALLSGRLRRRIESLGLDSFETYYRRMTDSMTRSLELPHFIAAVTTNETYFFRNESMWRHFSSSLVPYWMRTKKDSGRCLRIWSAAASSGEEAYTAALLLQEQLPDLHEWGIDIVGSDICEAMLSRAKAGLYSEYAISRVPGDLLARRFVRLPDGGFQLDASIRRMVRFQAHNLRDRSSAGRFDLVLLCNVLMYFDTPMKIRAIEVATEALAPGGHLYVGDIDPIRTLPELSSASDLQYVRPGVYQKPLQTAVNAPRKEAIAQAIEV